METEKGNNSVGTWQLTCIFTLPNITKYHLAREDLRFYWVLEFMPIWERRKSFTQHWPSGFNDFGTFFSLSLLSAANSRILCSTFIRWLSSSVIKMCALYAFYNLGFWWQMVLQHWLFSCLLERAELWRGCWIVLSNDRKIKVTSTV